MYDRYHNYSTTTSLTVRHYALFRCIVSAVALLPNITPSCPHGVDTSNNLPGFSFCGQGGMLRDVLHEIVEFVPVLNQVGGRVPHYSLAFSASSAEFFCWSCSISHSLVTVGKSALNLHVGILISDNAWVGQAAPLDSIFNLL